MNSSVVTCVAGCGTKTPPSMDEMMDGLGNDGHDIRPCHKTKMYYFAKKSDDFLHFSAKAPGEKVWNQTQNRSTLLEEVWSSFVNFKFCTSSVF